MEIGNRIQQLRKNKNISQEELASIMNVSRQAVSKWESNISIPDIEKIIDLSKYFSVSTDYLLLGKVEENQSNSKNELYLIISMIIKIILAIIMYILWREYLEHSLYEYIPIIICLILMFLIYKLENKLFELMNIKISINRYIFMYGWFYTIPITRLIHIIFFYVSEIFLKAIQLLMLEIPRKDIYIEIMYFLPRFQEYKYYFSTYIFIYIIINCLILMKVKKSLK